MAKSIGLVGTLSGKSGNFVFCKGADGRTIVRPYQPQVFNPKSSAQSLQRSKMVLAGKLSSITPSVVLVSMNAGRKVANRSAFVQNILRKSVSTSEGGDFQATILPEDIIFSRGIAPMRCTVATPVLSATRATVSVTPNISAELVGKAGVRLVAVVADKLGDGQNFVEIAFQDVVFASESTAQSVEITLSHLVSGQSYVGVYAIPFDITESAASQFAGVNGIDATGATMLAATLKTNPSMVKDWGDSRIVEDFIPFSV